MSEEDLDNTSLTPRELLRFALAVGASPQKIAEIRKQISEAEGK